MLQTVLTIISLCGTYLNCKKAKICFIIWIACNIGWTYIDFNSRVYSRMMLDIVQTAFCVYGYINWIDEKGEDKHV